MTMQVWIEPTALKEMRRAPGNVRHRLHRLALALAENPAPPGSRPLTPPAGWTGRLELRRVRLDVWRIVYVIDWDWQIVTVLAVRKRPPYDYEDLPELLDKID